MSLAQVMMLNKGGFPKTAFYPSSTCSQIAVSNCDEVMWRDCVSGNILHKFESQTGYIYSLVFSPCGSMFVSSSKDRELRLWDVQTKICLKVIACQSCVRSMKISPDSRLLATGSSDGTIIIHNLAAEYYTQVFEHRDHVMDIDFSRSGNLLASASLDKTVRLWNMLEEGRPGPVINHNSAVFCVAFSPIMVSGKDRFIFGCTDGSINVFDVCEESVRQVHVIHSHANPVYSLAFSPDGSQFVTTLAAAVQLWSAGGTLLKTITGHTDFVRSVVFHPNGRQIASSSFDKSVRIVTICEWSDRQHHLFGPELKRLVFVLMCVKARQENTNVPKRLSMQLWLSVFQQLSLICIS